MVHVFIFVLHPFSRVWLYPISKLREPPWKCRRQQKNKKIGRGNVTCRHFGSEYYLFMCFKAKNNKRKKSYCYRGTQVLVPNLASSFSSPLRKQQKTNRKKKSPNKIVFFLLFWCIYIFWRMKPFFCLLVCFLH